MRASQEDQTGRPEHLASAGTARARVLALADQLAERTPQPLEPLELAAVIESTGVTDEIARSDYEAETVFVLAERVFPFVVDLALRRRNQGHSAEDPHAPVRPREARRALLSVWLGSLLALAPLALLVAVTQLLAGAGWSSGDVLALSAGVTAAMLLTSGPLFALGRRASIYRGFGYYALASRFLRNGGGVVVLATSAMSAVAFAAARAAEIAAPGEREIFCIALAAGALLWVEVTYLLLVGDGLWLGTSLVTAVAAGVAVQLLVASALTGVAVTTGFALLLLLSGVARDALAKGDTIPLPKSSLLVNEGVPYALYGFGVMIFLLGPHALGWLGATDGVSRLRVVTSLELSLFVALVPLLLATSLLEPLLRGFWTRTRALEESGGAVAFRLGVASFHRQRIAIYVLVLSGLSALTVFAFEVLIRGTGAGRSVSSLVFLLAVVAYGLLGFGQFSCLLMLSLGEPRLAAASIAAGIVVSYAVAAPLALLDFRYVAIGFVAGAAAFVLTATYSWRSLLHRADHSYATAF